VRAVVAYSPPAAIRNANVTAAAAVIAIRARRVMRPEVDGSGLS
jgi:hypothetical protein